MLVRIRLITGLILVAYVTSHFLNHAVGIVSLEVKEAARPWFMAGWRHPSGVAILAGAAVGHLATVAIGVVQRRTLHMTSAEWTQLVLGVAIPVLLIEHVAGTIVAEHLFQAWVTYPVVQAVFWVETPWRAASQMALLLIVWGHACIGLHAWLRLKPWYRRAAPLPTVVATAVPAVALAGVVAGGMEARALVAADPQGFAEMLARFNRDAPEIDALVRFANERLVPGYLLLVAVVAGLHAGRRAWDARGGRIAVGLPDGRRLRLVPGMTVLEATRQAGVPHASVCGGRGRCSTCRVRVRDGLDALPPPQPGEAAILSRIGAPPSIRLACQMRPTADLDVDILLPPDASTKDALRQVSPDAGREQDVAVMFTDIRSFTKFSERRLPYDVVFILNRYFAAVGEAVVENGGYLDKFIGDGAMALFGLEDGPAGARNAIAAARDTARSLEALNQALCADLPEPLRIGIGLHWGPAILGEMGYARARTLTAIGDTVNVASRIEGLTKTHGVQLAISRDLAIVAGVDLSRFPAVDEPVRGRSKPVTLHLVGSALDLPG